MEEKLIIICFSQNLKSREWQRLYAQELVFIIGTDNENVVDPLPNLLVPPLEQPCLLTARNNK